MAQNHKPKRPAAQRSSPKFCTTFTKLPQLVPTCSPPRVDDAKVASFLVKSRSISKPDNSLTNSVNTLDVQEKPIKRIPKALDPIKNQQALDDIRVIRLRTLRAESKVRSAPCVGRQKIQDQAMNTKIPKLMDPFKEITVSSPPPRTFPSLAEGSKIPIRIKARAPLPAIKTVIQTIDLDAIDKNCDKAVEEEQSSKPDNVDSLVTDTKSQVKGQETSRSLKAPTKSNAVQEIKNSSKPIVSPVFGKKKHIKVQVEKCKAKKHDRSQSSADRESVNKKEIVQDSKISTKPVVATVVAKSTHRRIQDFKVEFYDAKKPQLVHSPKAFTKNADVVNETKSSNTVVDPPVKVEIGEEIKPLLSHGTKVIKDVRVDSKRLKFGRTERKKIDLLTTKFSLKKVTAKQERFPGKEARPYEGVDRFEEIEPVLTDLQKLFDDLLQIKAKHTNSSRSLADGGSSDAVVARDKSHVAKLKTLVKDMTRTVAEIDSGLEYERNISRYLMDDGKLKFNMTEKIVNRNLVFPDKKQQKFNKLAKQLTGDDANVKKSLEEKETYQNIEFEYMEGLVINSIGKDKAQERCKEVLAINEALQKDLTCKLREVKNLRSDMKKRANCPINVVDEYTTLKKERNGMNIQIAQLMTDANDAARRRMSIDATNQKLRNQIDKLKFLVQELGGEVPVFPDCEVKKEKFKFGRPIITPPQTSVEMMGEVKTDFLGSSDQENQDLTSVLDGNNNSSDMKTREEMVNKRNAENENEKLNESSSMIEENDTLSMKGTSELLQNIAKKLQGNKVDLSLTGESPRAIRFYFNSDLVTKELGRLQRQFTMTTAKDSMVTGNDVVFKRIGKKKVRTTLGKKKIRKLISTNKNDREIPCISEETLINNETTGDITSTGSEREQDEIIVKDHEVKGDFMLLLRGPSS